jgi:methyl-accepting chemotaxis protein
MMATQQTTSVSDEVKPQEELQNATQAGVPTTGKEYRAMSQETEAIASREDPANEQKLIKVVSRYMRGSSIGVAVLAFAIWVIFPQYVQFLVLAGSIVPLVIGAGLSPVLYGRRQREAGTYCLLAPILVVLVVFPFILPEVVPALGIGYIFVVIHSLQLLGERRSRWLIAISVLAFVADMVLINVWHPNWFTPLEETISVVFSVLLNTITTVFTVISIRQVVTSREKQSREMLRVNAEIADRVAAEQRQREAYEAVVEQYANYMTEVRKGNLTAGLDYESNGHGVDDHLVALGHDLNETVIVFRDLLAQVQEASANLGTSTAEIMAATSQQVAGASEQSAAISQTTTTTDEVRVISEQAIQRAQEVVNASQRTVEVSRSGQEVVQETIGSMAQIKARVEGIAENILALSEQTQQIGEIISTVSDIASQSNMLALNASVEAARAGEQGKGFAVVAAEVRNLAEQSRQATAQIKAILLDIQNGINSTVMATEEGAKVVDEGLKLAAGSGEVIEQLAAAINEAAQAAMQMRAGGQQQATGVEQIALAMQNINQATTQSLTSTRQTEKAAQDLNTLAYSLAEIVELYQIQDEGPALRGLADNRRLGE